MSVIRIPAAAVHEPEFVFGGLVLRGLQMFATHDETGGAGVEHELNPGAFDNIDIAMRKTGEDV